MPSYGNLDPRDFVPFPSQKQGFGVPILLQKHPDKTHLRETIFLMRQEGMSYREIGKYLDIDASRVWQLFKTIDENKL
jgi:DNA-binding CsgD family transcriptional regulator